MDAWPHSPARAGLATSEKHQLALKAVSSTTDPFEAWQRLGVFGMNDEPFEDGRLFHLRRSPGATRRIVVRQMRAAAVRIALCPSPGVPKAPCVRHPVSVSDAVAFSLLGPRILDIEAVAREAADALDEIGQPTHALALAGSDHNRRRIVWRTGIGEKRLAHRAAVLLAVKLLEQHGSGRWWEPVGLGPGREAVHESHYCEWSRIRLVAVGVLAWRAAVGRGLRVTATRPERGSRFYVRPEAVGRAFADLGMLGVELAACSSEAIVLELRP